jgi:hypothetical protein
MAENRGRKSDDKIEYLELGMGNFSILDFRFRNADFKKGETWLFTKPKAETDSYFLSAFNFEFSALSL